MNARQKTSSLQPAHEASARMMKERLYQERNDQLECLNRITGPIFRRDPSSGGNGEIGALRDTHATMAEVIQKLPSGKERDRLLELHLAADAAASEIAQLTNDIQLAVAEAGYGLTCIVEMLNKMNEERIDLGNLCALISPLARQVNQSGKLLQGAL